MSVVYNRMGICCIKLNQASAACGDGYFCKDRSVLKIHSRQVVEESDPVLTCDGPSHRDCNILGNFARLGG